MRRNASAQRINAVADLVDALVDDSVEVAVVTLVEVVRLLTLHTTRSTPIRDALVILEVVLINPLEGIVVVTVVVTTFSPDVDDSNEVVFNLDLAVPIRIISVVVARIIFEEIREVSNQDERLEAEKPMHTMQQQAELPLIQAEQPMVGRTAIITSSITKDMEDRVTRITLNFRKTKCIIWMSDRRRLTMKPWRCKCFSTMNLVANIMMMAAAMLTTVKDGDLKLVKLLAVLHLLSNMMLT